MKYVKGLDTLRAMAVLLVIHEHWGPHSFKTSVFLTFIFQKIIPDGKFGVDFFFVLSGFLITGILLDAKNDNLQVNWLTVLRNFVARRCLRIFPIYYLCLILLFILNYPDVRKDFAYLITYTENFLVFKRNFWDAFCHTWSLAVEEQFYLIWPLIILLSPKRLILPVLISFIILGTAAGLITAYLYGPYAIVLPFNCFNAFAIGGLYSLARMDSLILARFKQTLTYALPLAILLYLFLAFGYLNCPGRIFNAIISISLIIYVVEAKYSRFFSAVIHNRVLVKIGQISYGVYLYHFCVPHYYYSVLKYAERKLLFPAHFSALLEHPAFAELAEFIILIIISYLSYNLIEARFLKLKKYFVYEKIAHVTLT